MRTLSSICLSIFIATAGNAFAVGAAGDLDVTIQMMDARQTVDEFINRIELPKDPGGNIPAATRTSTQQTPPGAGDARKRRDGEKSDDERRGGDERSDRQGDTPDTDRPRAGDDADNRSPSGFRDRAVESRGQRENLQEASREQREQQESNRQNSRDNWDRIHDSYPPSAWPDRQK